MGEEQRRRAQRQPQRCSHTHTFPAFPREAAPTRALLPLDAHVETTALSRLLSQSSSRWGAAVLKPISEQIIQSPFGDQATAKDSTQEKRLLLQLLKARISAQPA